MAVAIRLGLAGLLAVAGAPADAQSLAGLARETEARTLAATTPAPAYALDGDQFQDVLLTDDLVDRYAAAREMAGRLFTLDALLYERVDERLRAVRRNREAGAVYALEPRAAAAFATAGLTPQAFVDMVLTIDWARSDAPARRHTDARAANRGYLLRHPDVFPALEDRLLHRQAWRMPLPSMSRPY